MSKIEEGSICVLWKGSLRARLVRVVRVVEQGRAWHSNDYYTVSYFESGGGEKGVSTHELTLVENELEVLAWLAPN